MILHWQLLFLAKKYSRTASSIREYARTAGLTVDWSGNYAVPPPKTMMAFRFPHRELFSTTDLNCKFFSKSDGTNPHLTASKPINATTMTAAVVFRQFNGAKQQATKRIKSITIVTIFLVVY